MPRTAPLVAYTSLGGLIDKAKPGEVIKGVIFATKPQLDTASAMLKSSGKPFAMLHSVGNGRSPKESRGPAMEQDFMLGASAPRGMGSCQFIQFSMQVSTCMFVYFLVYAGVHTCK